MKKILSLVLVCVMMISALILTSCQDTYKNVESFVITLLYYQSYQNEVDESKKELYTIGKAPGFKVEVTLKKKKGYAENTDKFSSIIKFRNEGK